MRYRALSIRQLWEKNEEQAFNKDMYVERDVLAKFEARSTKFETNPNAKNSNDQNKNKRIQAAGCYCLRF